MTAIPKISPSLRHYRKTAIEYTLAGLTCKGTERKRRPNFNGLFSGLRNRIQASRERSLTAWDLRVNRLRSMGLTTRGTPRIYAVRRGDAILLRSQIDGLAQSITEMFDSLTPAAQVKALKLANHLSDIRRQIL